jgi:hypothetical protein
LTAATNSGANNRLTLDADMRAVTGEEALQKHGFDAALMSRRFGAPVRRRRRSRLVADELDALRRITRRRKRAEREWLDEIRRLFTAGHRIEQISAAAGARYEVVVEIVARRSDAASRATAGELRIRLGERALELNGASVGSGP